MAGPAPAAPRPVAPRPAPRPAAPTARPAPVPRPAPPPPQNPGWQQVPPAAPPPKKKMGKGKIALIVIGSILVLAIIGAMLPDSTPDDDESPTGASQQTSTSPASDPLTVVLGYENKMSRGVYVYTSIILPGPLSGALTDCTSHQSATAYIPAGGRLVDTCTGKNPTEPDNAGKYGDVSVGWYDTADDVTEDGQAKTFIESQPNGRLFFTTSIESDGSMTIATTETRPTGPTSNPIPPPPPPAAITFSGTGSKVTQTFTTENKLLRFEATHNGESNFIIWFLDSQGNKDALAVNTIGDYDGSRYFGLTPGSYVLEIDADGPWEVTIDQPEPTTGPSAPVTQQGTTDTAAPCVDFGTGLHRFNMNYVGDSNFIVWLFDDRGNQVKLLANEIDSWTGEAAHGITRAGFYCLDIQAEGSWSVSITR